MLSFYSAGIVATGSSIAESSICVASTYIHFLTLLNSLLFSLSSRAIFFRLPVFALNHLLIASYHSGRHPNAHNSGVETFAVSKADIVRIIYDRQLRVLDKTNKA